MRTCYAWCVLFLFWAFALAWEGNSLLRISQSVASSAHLSHCWICHPKPSAALGPSDPLVVPVVNFSQIPTFQVMYDAKFPKVVYRVRLVNHELPVPCFFLTPPERFTAVVSGENCTKPESWGCASLPAAGGRAAAACQYQTCFTDPVSLPLIRQRCANLSSAYAPTRLCRAWRDRDASHPKDAPTPLQSCRMTPTGTLPRTDPWLEDILSHLPQGDSLNFQNMTGVLCAPTGYIFVCGSNDEAWAYRCLDSWRVGGTCLLGYLVTPFSVHNVSEAALTLFTGVARGGLAGDGYFSGDTLLPWWGAAAHPQVLRNLSETLAIIANEAAASLPGLHASSDALAKVVLGNRTALDYVLAEQGGVCVVAGTACCMYINSSSAVETHSAAIRQQAPWLQPASERQSRMSLGGMKNRFKDLFEQKLNGVRSILGGIKLGLAILLIVILFIILLYCVIKCCVNKAKPAKTDREIPMITLRPPCLGGALKDVS
ncbi:endogenous retrovirus group V member 2 Env polyprotein-like [Phyllostomus discolor]|uniref:Endogenous retrovirus group V member 2 Env polyprotein-like n=1 Tax=Phyllostomus discolor TaxID=89673 RepID=A0A7E6CVH2_9CHIR|nr:endogenous retrovirus group V member 2 Env polyprotein-like [Phyllostomus discolor]